MTAGSRQVAATVCKTTESGALGTGGRNLCIFAVFIDITFRVKKHQIDFFM
jgi:hypothetical protein